MPRFNQKSLAVLAGVFLLAWLALKYILPLAMPFLLGIALALAAEPLVGLLSRRMKRGLAAGIGVSATLLLLTGVLVVLAAALLRELGLLAGVLPDLGQTAQSGLTALEGFLLGLTRRLPEGVQPLLSRSVTGFFSNGSAILGKLLQRLSVIASAFLGSIPGGALTVGTGILSGFMVSVRLPKLRAWTKTGLPQTPLGSYLPVWKQVRSALGGWLKAQLKLMGLCFAILCAGFLLLRVSHGPIWAFLIALVDAIPVLGTGTVLLPWSLINLLQGDGARAIGILGIYITVTVVRSVLEPKLLGRHLGLDPLVTLMALYAGFKLWGIGGMILAPLLAVTAIQLVPERKQ